MNINENPVLICEEDFRLLKQYAGNASGSEEMSLAHELSRATIVKEEDLPRDTIRLNSKVSIEEVQSKKVTEFTIVMPANADIKQRKISILTPMAAALIGFRAGNVVSWKMPAGMRQFKVLDVQYHAVVP